MVLLFRLQGSLVLEQSTQIHFAIEVGLGAGGEVGEDFWVGIPCCDTFMVFSAVFVIDDKGDNLVSEAFFEHDQSSKTAVAVFEGMNPFKADVKVQNISQLHFFLGLIFLN